MAFAVRSQVDLVRDLRKKLPATDPGSPLMDVYKLRYRDDGTQTLEVIGQRNIYEEIQSHADSVDIHVILGMCMRKGDYALLYQREGFYGDLSEMPSTYAEVLQHVHDAEEVWKSLPADVKEKFNNSVSEFYASAFTPEWAEKIELKKDAPLPVDPVAPIKEEGAVNE